MSDYISLTDFTNEVILAIGDVPTEIAENYVRMAAIKLCNTAQVLHRDASFDLWCGEREYELPEYEHEVIIAVDKVFMGSDCHGKPRPLSRDCGRIKVELPDRVFLTPAPAEDMHEGLMMRFVVVPKQDACEVARVLYDRYNEAIVNGAIARLLALPAMTWYNPQAALLYEARADKAIAVANADRITGPMRGPFKLKHRRFV